MSMNKYKIKLDIDTYQDSNAKYRLPSELRDAFAKYLDDKGVIYKQKENKFVVKGEYDHAILKLVLGFNPECRFSFGIDKKSKITGEWFHCNLEGIYQGKEEKKPSNIESTSNEKGFANCLDDEEKKILTKIDSGEKLSEKELKFLVEYEIERHAGENRRWTRSIESIVEIGGRHFSVDWEEGLTECQENEFYEQPVEVEMHEYEKTITVREWTPVEKEEDIER